MFTRGDNREKTAEKSSAEAAVFAKGGESRFHLFHRIGAPRTSLLIGSFVLLAIACGAVLAVNHFTAEPLVRTEGVNAAQSASNRLASLTSNPPAASSSPSHKSDYYAKLALAKADSKDYAGAAQAFDDKAKVNPSSMVYTDYYIQARWYQLAGNKSAALTALETCEKLLPTQDNDETGYYRQDMISRITTLRQEIQR